MEQSTELLVVSNLNAVEVFTGPQGVKQAKAVIGAIIGGLIQHVSIKY